MSTEVCAGTGECHLPTEVCAGAPGVRRRRRRFRAGTIGVAALLVPIGLGVAPCHWSATPAAAQGTQGSAPLEVRVSLTEWALTPARITVPAGRLIRFVASNDGALPHALAVEGDGVAAETDTIGSAEQGRLELSFPAPGTYDMFCPLNFGEHRALGQDGTVVVAAAQAGTLLPRTGDDDWAALGAGGPLRED